MRKRRFDEERVFHRLPSNDGAIDRMKKPDEHLLGKLYRGFASSAPVRMLIGRVVSEERLRAGYMASSPIQAPGSDSRSDSRLWFHAASVGELESLWPVIRAWAEGGGEVVVTIFSESAKSSLGRLRDELSKIGDGRRLIHAGYSPLEGAWRRAVSAYAPTGFVTAKYESWPDLWSALAENGTPLFVVGARPRASLRIAALASRLLQGQEPALRFFCGEVADRRALEQAFPNARVLPGGDPRWERVRERASAGSPRARGIVECMKALPRPWGVLGSAWLSDLEVWSDSLKQVPSEHSASKNSVPENSVPENSPPGNSVPRSSVAGTLWVVPHRVDGPSIEAIQRQLEGEGRHVLRTSTLTASPENASETIGPKQARPKNSGPEKNELDKTTTETPILLVDEMGFLLELYSSADWAYVGGGFEAGVHSTIEPAIQGIPISAGTKRADRFPEIAELQRDGQLTLITDADQLAAWLANKANADATSRAHWKESASARFGATEEIVRAIKDDLLTS